MKLFKVSEANKLLPEIIPKLKKIRLRYSQISLLDKSVKAAAAAAKLGGGGMKGGSRYIESLFEIGKLTIEINNLGIQLKDHTRGLIDFPAKRDGRIVLLCWQLGEEAEINWWHELEGGFSARKPL